MLTSRADSVKMSGMRGAIQYGFSWVLQQFLEEKQ
jgi:hypothetical protein